MDKGAWQATVHGVTKSRTRLKGLSMHTHIVLVLADGTSKSKNISPVLLFKLNHILINMYNIN